MKLGEVFIWETQQVKGFEKRKKRHIYVYSEGGMHVFLFINSAEYWCDHKILKANYDDFLDYDSYVGGNGVAAYSNDYIKALNLQPVGQITPEDLKKIRDAIIKAETMEQREAVKVCAALAAAL